MNGVFGEVAVLQGGSNGPNLPTNSVPVAAEHGAARGVSGLSHLLPRCDQSSSIISVGKRKVPTTRRASDQGQLQCGERRPPLPF
jgi:hypothetical protein